MNAALEGKQNEMSETVDVQNECSAWSEDSCPLALPNLNVDVSQPLHTRMKLWTLVTAWASSLQALRQVNIEIGEHEGAGFLTSGAAFILYIYGTLKYVKNVTT